MSKRWRNSLLLAIRALLWPKKSSTTLPILLKRKLYITKLFVILSVVLIVQRRKSELQSFKSTPLIIRTQWHFNSVQCVQKKLLKLAMNLLWPFSITRLCMLGGFRSVFERIDFIKEQFWSRHPKSLNLRKISREMKLFIPFSLFDFFTLPPVLL